MKWYLKLDSLGLTNRVNGKYLNCMEILDLVQVNVYVTRLYPTGKENWKYSQPNNERKEW